MSSSNPLDALTPQNPSTNLGGQPMSSGNPLDQLSKENPTPSLPTPTAQMSQAGPAPVNGNPLDQLLIKPQPAETPAAATSAPSLFTRPGNPLDSLNPLDRLNPVGRVLTNQEAAYGNSDPEKMEDEPWYSKAWEWMNSPLYDLHKWGTRTGAGTFERGLETGLEDIGSGFLTPLQLGLTIATFGGSTVETAGISALRSIGVSEIAAPIVARGAKALMTAGFSAQMIGGMLQQSPQLLDALKDGDTENATRLATNIAASGLFLTQGLKHGYEDVNAVKNYVKGKNLTTTERLALVTELAGNYDAAKSAGTDFARSRQENIVAQLKAAGAFGNDITEAGMRHFITQGGDLERIAKMRGIADGTIKPRPLTAEELTQQDQAAELRDWAGKSHDITKRADGSLQTFYVDDGAPGTHKLGQTLSASGDENDAHYVQMKNPFSLRTEESLKKYVEQAGGENEAKTKLADAGYDGIVYKTAEGEPKLIAFENDQYRPVPEFKSAHDAAWNREHAYYAVDKKNLEHILNQGIGKNPKKANVVYSATPEEALKSATLPDSGKKSDLTVLSVPRAEVEASVRETNAAIHGKLKRGSIGPVEVAGKSPVEGEVAYRVRDAGEEGVPSQSHSQATMSLDEAKKYLESRGKIQGKPQEIVAIPLNGLEYDRRQGPNGNDWIKFKKDLPESGVRQLSDLGKPNSNSVDLVGGNAYDMAHELAQRGLPKNLWGNKAFAETVQYLTNSIDRAKEQIKQSGQKFKDAGKNIEITLRRISPDESVHLRGDSRYSPKEMADYLKSSGKELPPIQIGQTEENGMHLLDGHHRWRAYQDAGKNPLAFVIKTTEGEVGKPKVTLNVENISGASHTSPVADDMLITEKRHMPGHLLETEVDKDGNPKATGRSFPLRPLGAEDMPGDNSRFNNSYTEAEKQKYLAGLDAAQRLTPEQQEIAKTIRKIYDNSFQRAWEKGMVRDWVQSYHPQAWANDPGGMWKWLFNKDTEKVTNGALNDLRHQTNDGSFDTNINSARHRAFNTEFQGIMAGEKFKSDDLSMHLFNHLKAVEHAAASRDYLNNLRKQDTKATDGRPAVVLHGTARVIGGDSNPAVAISPEAAQSVRITPDKVEMMRVPDPKTGVSPLQDGLEKGIIQKLPWTTPDEKGNNIPAYAYTSDGYVLMDHPSTRSWGYIGQDTAGNPALMEGKMMVHPDFEKHVRQVLGIDKSIVRESKILSGINTAAGEAKGLMLSISPFHIVQEGLRALMVGINPLKYEHMDANENPNLLRGVKNGLTRNDYQAEDNYSSGYASHSKIISKVPGLNRMQSAMQSFLFEKYIPGLKDRAYLKLYEDVLAKNPSLLPDEAASRAADMTNDVFGGQNWRKLGVSTSQQDFMRMFALAPDWLTSEIRMGMRAFGMMDKETGALSRRMMATQMAFIWGAARVMNMIASGQMHNEAPFGVVRKNDKGEEVVYSVRTLPTDIVHALSDPRGFIAGRVNPLTVRPTVEFIAGRDAMGRRAPMDVQAHDLIRNIVPIVGQNLIKGNDVSTLDQIYKGTGGNVYRYRTEAEKMAEQYASDRMPSGPVDPENLQAHQREIRLEDAYRKGQIGKGELKQNLAPRRVDEVVRRSHMTPLQARFDRLPISEAINVWNSSTSQEKDTLHDVLWKKKREWLKLHKPAERSSEPVWRKIQNTWADLR